MSVCCACYAGLFNIDNSSGLITTAVPMAGLIGTYYLTVSAYDHGSPSRSTPVAVTIVVSNSPNLIPIWNQPPADGFVVYTPEVNSRYFSQLSPFCEYINFIIITTWNSLQCCRSIWYCRPIIVSALGSCCNLVIESRMTDRLIKTQVNKTSSTHCIFLQMIFHMKGALALNVKSLHNVV